MSHSPKRDDLPDPIDNKGRWCVKDGRMHRAIQYEGGSVRWVEEGSAMHAKAPGGPMNTYRLRYGRLDRFVEWLRGGPLEAE